MRPSPAPVGYLSGHQHGSATVDVETPYTRHESVVKAAMTRDGLVLPLLEDRVLRLSLNCKTSLQEMQRAYVESCTVAPTHAIPWQELQPFFIDFTAAFDEIWSTPPWSLPHVAIMDARRLSYLCKILVVDITYIELPADGTPLLNTASA